MVRLVWLVALAACGKVATLADAPSHDTSSLGSGVDATVCTLAETMCGTSCVDEMTDNANCGACESPCGTNTACLTGHCVDSTESCAVIFGLDPTKPSGPYTHAADGHQFFCDMVHGPTQYEELAFGVYNVAHTGYDFVNATDLADPVVQKAFVWLYNHQGGGLDNLPPQFTPGNCCIKESMVAGQMLELDGSILFVATVGASEAQYCNQPTTAAQYDFYLAVNNVFPGNPMSSTFFTMYPPNDVQNCSDANNAAMFWKRHP